MKEYRGCKYYELEEIKNGVSLRGAVQLPYVMVVAGIGEESVPVNTELKLEDLMQSENPEELLETTSKNTIDTFVEERNKYLLQKG